MTTIQHSNLRLQTRPHLPSDNQQAHTHFCAQQKRLLDYGWQGIHHMPLLPFWLQYLNKPFTLFKQLFQGFLGQFIR